MKEAALCLAFLLFPLASVSQTSDSKNSGTASEKQSLTPAPAEQPADTSNFTSAKGFVLEDSIPVKLRINRTISSADCHVGDTVDFEVVQDVSVNGTLVIPKGGLAFATVTEAQAKRRMARGQGPQGRRSHGSHGGRHRGDRHCVFSGSAIFPVHARQGHHHPERD